MTPPKLIHVLLIRQNLGARIIKIQIGLPGLSVPGSEEFSDRGHDSGSSSLSDLGALGGVLGC